MVYKTTIGLLIGAIIVSIVISMALAWLVAASITSPLSLAIEGLKEVAQGQGDLTKRLDASGKDEVGELTKWFNAFIENLQAIISKVAENTRATSEASHQLLELAQKTTGNASDLAERSRSVSESSDE